MTKSETAPYWELVYKLLLKWQSPKRPPTGTGLQSPVKITKSKSAPYWNRPTKLAYSLLQPPYRNWPTKLAYKLLLKWQSLKRPPTGKLAYKHLLKWQSPNRPPTGNWPTTDLQTCEKD